MGSGEKPTNEECRQQFGGICGKKSKNPDLISHTWATANDGWLVLATMKCVMVERSRLDPAKARFEHCLKNRRQMKKQKGQEKEKKKESKGISLCTLSRERVPVFSLVFYRRDRWTNYILGRSCRWTLYSNLLGFWCFEPKSICIINYIWLEGIKQMQLTAVYFYFLPFSSSGEAMWCSPSAAERPQKCNIWYLWVIKR